MWKSLTLGLILTRGAVLPAEEPAPPATESVKATLHCLSLRFAAAKTTVAEDAEYLAEISSEPELPTNGELMLMPPDIAILYSHGGFLHLTDKRTGQTRVLPLNVDIPEFRDDDQDGFHDFFEIDQPVSETTTRGNYDTGEGELNDLAATWSRAAGSKDGVCQLTLAGLNLTFRHRFELIQLDGRFDYQRDAISNLIGHADLRSGNQALARLEGPAELTVATSDQLYLATGTWTDDEGAKMPFEVPSALDRKNHHYLGYLAFEDGDPRTKIIDYIDWVLVVDDPRDADGDGVPDLTDLGDPPAPPALALEVTSEQAFLTLVGEVGRTYEVETSTDMIPGEWAYALTVTLTNTTQRLSVPLRAEEHLFWRAKAP